MKHVSTLFVVALVAVICAASTQNADAAKQKKEANLAVTKNTADSMITTDHHGQAINQIAEEEADARQFAVTMDDAAGHVIGHVVLVLNTAGHAIGQTMFVVPNTADGSGNLASFRAETAHLAAEHNTEGSGGTFTIGPDSVGGETLAAVVSCTIDCS